MTEDRPAQEPDIETIEAALLSQTEDFERKLTWLSTVASMVSLALVGALAGWAGYSVGVAQTVVRTVERIGDPRMHMQIPVAGGDASAYVHPVRRTSEKGGVPDITFTTEIPDALADLPAGAFCGVAPALTLCRPHLVRLGPDSTAYVMEPDADRLDADTPE